MESSQESSSYYSILGVSMDSSDDQIRRAYRKLAM
ncbi:DnaJ domain-containing protein, partial [Cynara cardunculus var. scolymus]